jgi:hypothetical protein
LNNNPVLKDVGIKFCLQKSGIIRLFGVWLKPYRSLGLCLYSPMSIYEQIVTLLNDEIIPLELKGMTRGRGANPVTGKASTNPSHEKLNYLNVSKTKELNLRNLILEYRPYFGLLMSKLYGSPKNLKFSKTSRILPSSLLGQLLRKKINKILLRTEKINIFNSNSKMTKLMINLYNKDNNELIE